MRVYFDYASTTPVDPRVVKAMQPYFFDQFGNPASVHSFGRQAQSAVDAARQQLADFLNAKPLDIIFTSGATESNNLAIQGLVKPGDHVVTTQIEHLSVLAVCQRLEKQGIKVSYVGVDKDGLVNPKEVIAAVGPKTKLISVMLANNEIGTIQPIAKIGEAVKAINANRKEKIYFHTDAVQAAAYLNLDVDSLNVDLMSLSGHKIYGPKGAGVLYRRQSVDLAPISYGGSQEFNLRPGTLNPAGIIGLSQAIGLLTKQGGSDAERTKSLRDKLKVGITEIFPKVVFNGGFNQRLANNLNCSFIGFDSEQLLIALDQAGIAVSVGSACSAGSLVSSHVLKAVGLSDDLAAAGIRITLGRYSTEKEVVYFLNRLATILAN